MRRLLNFILARSFAATFAAPGDAAASPSFFAKGSPAAICQVDPPTTWNPRYEYANGALKSTGSGLSDIFVAACPLSEVFFGYNLYGIQMSYVNNSTTEMPCWMEDFSGRRIWETYLPPDGVLKTIYLGELRGSEYLSVTVYCTLGFGSSINSFSTLWKKP